MVNLEHRLYRPVIQMHTHTHTRAGRILIGRLYFVSIFHTLDTPSSSMGASNNWRVDCELRVSSSSTPTFPSVSRTSRVENTVLSTSRGINKCKYRKRKRRREKRYLSPPSFFSSSLSPSFFFLSPLPTNKHFNSVSHHASGSRSRNFYPGAGKIKFSSSPRIYIYVLIEIHLLADGGRRIDCVRGGKEREREREEKKERRSLWPCNQHVRETRYTRSMYRLRDRAIKLAIHSISEQYLREMITRMGEHRWPILATAFVRRQTRLREMDR